MRSLVTITHFVVYQIVKDERRSERSNKDMFYDKYILRTVGQQGGEREQFERLKEKFPSPEYIVRVVTTTTIIAESDSLINVQADTGEDML